MSDEAATPGRLQVAGLPPRQQHAVVQGMEETLLRNPPAAVYKLLVHEGNLTCRTAKTDKPKLQPKA